MPEHGLCDCSLSVESEALIRGGSSPLRVMLMAYATAWFLGLMYTQTAFGRSYEIQPTEF